MNFEHITGDATYDAIRNVLWGATDIDSWCATWDVTTLEATLNATRDATFIATYSATNDAAYEFLNEL